MEEEGKKSLSVTIRNQQPARLTAWVSIWSLPLARLSLDYHLKTIYFYNTFKKKYWSDKTLSKLKGQEKQNTPNKTSMVLQLSNTNGPTIFSAPCFFNFYYQMYKMYSLAHKKPLEWKHMYAYTLYNDKKHLSPAVNQLVSDKGMWVGVREFESPMP